VMALVLSAKELSKIGANGWTVVKPIRANTMMYMAPVNETGSQYMTSYRLDECTDQKAYANQCGRRKPQRRASGRLESRPGVKSCTHLRVSMFHESEFECRLGWRKALRLQRSAVPLGDSAQDPSYSTYEFRTRSRTALALNVSNAIQHNRVSLTAERVISAQSTVLTNPQHSERPCPEEVDAL
jgi:hypothetical protein